MRTTTTTSWTTLAGSLLPGLAMAAAGSGRGRGADCTTITECVPSTGAAHIIVSRASTEAPGPGILLSVAEAIIDSCPGSDFASNPCEWTFFFLTWRGREVER